MPDDRSLAGKRVVITGAGRGLGRALAITVADQGAEVVLLGRDPAALRAVAGIIASRTGRAALLASCDLADADSIRAACRMVLAANPTVDILINNGAQYL